MTVPPMRDPNPILDTKEACYTAFRAHDARFDGRVFIGVISTGIYCRPICRVRTPRIENCFFYGNAAAAEAAGFRPCLKCRPELAPGSSSMDMSKRLTENAAFVIEKDCLFDGSIATLSAELGVSDRHLRRIFAAEFGISPVQYLQTRRLLLAKNLLTDTALPVSGVALSAGFGSIRRFNDLFKRHYRLTPTALRRETGKPKANPGQSTPQTMTLRLGYRPPYRWEQLLSFLAARAIPGVESTTENTYRRTVTLQSGKTVVRGWISVQNDDRSNQLLLTFPSSLLPLISPLLVRVRMLFDLDCEPLEIYCRLMAMNKISAGLCIAGTRLPGCFDPYEMAVRAVLGQQITIKAARTLAMRLAIAFGEHAVTPYDELNRFFPSPETIRRLSAPIENQLGPLGVTAMKARSIQALARAMDTGSITLSRHADPKAETEKLLALPGIGQWTTQYIAMRAMSWPDAFPHTDYGVRKALQGMSENDILNISQAWRPWRSYATMNLWHSIA